MADLSLAPGLKGEYRVRVTEAHTAHHTGHTGVYVYSTPQLVLAMEMACTAALAGHLPEGWNHVGTKNDMTHLAATPVGFDVVAKAELAEVDGRRLVFRVEAYDDTEKIGEGRHERFVVEWSRFQARLEAKAKGKG
ncbi:MAG: thioesterase [Dehalococcoidia bacterium]|nr:thioesterase [Dehalococcoidia bacterium]